MKVLIVAAVLFACGAQAQPRPAQSMPQSLAPNVGFTPAQRAEIVQVLRDALRSDPSILREAVDALQQDDQHLQDAASRQAIAARRQALTADPADPSAGPASADVTIVEFYDTRCPYCRRLLPTLALLLKADPALRVVYKDLPILGPNSTLEARALLAAQRQGGYLRLQDAVMRDTGPATPERLREAAEAVGLDGARLLQDMADPAIAARLEGTLQLAHALHVEGTPAFVIGSRLIPGAVELADLQEAVAALRHGK